MVSKIVKNERRKIFILFYVTIALIFLVVLTGITVRFLTTDDVSRIVIITLICFLAVFGIFMIVFLEILRRKSANSKNRTLNNNAYLSAPTGPPRGTSWEYTNRSTLQA